MSEHVTEMPAVRGPSRVDGYLPLASYAAIGDGRSLAMVAVDGSIDWMCLPDLDSPSVFGSVLDVHRGGSFQLAPAVPFTSTQRYVERTNALQTTFETAEGKVRVTDAFTIDAGQAVPWRELVRSVEGLSGAVPMTWRLEPRFEYGQRPASFSRHGDAFVAHDGRLSLSLQVWDAGEPVAGRETVTGSFRMGAGDNALLVVAAVEDQPLIVTERDAVQRRLRQTAEVWRDWVSHHSYQGPWTAAVERSLLALKLLADGRSGAIAAAGTTSLPEVIGGQRNYDYRYGWVRDCSFTVDAMIRVSMREVAQSSVSWLLQATRSTHPRIDPVYSLSGPPIHSQGKLPLAGYRASAPAHVGNQAGSQLQLGGFGDLLETVWNFVQDGHILPARVGERLADVGDLLALIWRREDAGLWELGSTADYATSKIGCWTAFERLLGLADAGQAPARHVERWRRERDALREFIDTQLWSDDKRSYLMKRGSDALDCGVLLAARRRYPGATAERLNGTIDAISRELHAEGPLYYRYSGMQEQENAFLACSFWMVEALAVADRRDEAGELMDGAVSAGSQLGLFTEEMEPGSREMRGNFPQALTHLALISAADMLAQADRSR